MWTFTSVVLCACGRRRLYTNDYTVASWLNGTQDIKIDPQFILYYPQPERCDLNSIKLAWARRHTLLRIQNEKKKVDNPPLGT